MPEEVLDQIKSINESMTETMRAAQAAQETAKKLTDDQTKTDSTVQTAVEKSTEAAAKAQELQLKMESFEKTVQFMEKTISRGGSFGGDQQLKEMETKAQNELLQYLRKGVAMSEDVRDFSIRDICEKTLLGVSKEAKELEFKDLVSGVNPDGGYFIRPERSAMMIKRIFETSPMRSICNVQSTNTSAVEFIIDDNEADTGGWVGEVDTRPVTGTPQIGKLTIPIHEQYANPRATQKMVDDAGFNIEQWLSDHVTMKMTRVENTAHIVGDGSQKPRGILALPSWAAAGTYERGALERRNSGTSGQVTADSMKLLQNDLIEDYQANATWLMNRQTWGQVITLKDLDNNYLLDPRSMKVGDSLVLLGKAVRFAHDMPVPGADTQSVAYGDFRVGYTIIDRFGFRVIRDVYTNKPYILYYTTKRTGGDVTNYEAIKILQLTA